jgi:hypothetical protein
VNPGDQRVHVLPDHCEHVRTDGICVRRRDQPCVTVTFDEGRRPLQPSDVVTLTASDLSDLSRKAMRMRRNDPDRALFVDIHVAMADKASAARASLAAAGGTAPMNTLVYVGTPAGLAGLLKDIHTLGLADGAFLRPLLTAQLDLICARVLPVLQGEMPGFSADLSSAAKPHEKENAR